jgi:hypothetical protein
MENCNWSFTMSSSFALKLVCHFILVIYEIFNSKLFQGSIIVMKSKSLGKLVQTDLPLIFLHKIINESIDLGVAHVLLSDRCPVLQALVELLGSDRHVSRELL